MTQEKINALPEVLSVKDIRGLLNIGQAKAYELVNRKDCPKLPIDKPIRVPKMAFLKWVKLL